MVQASYECVSTFGKIPAMPRPSSGPKKPPKLCLNRGGFLMLSKINYFGAVWVLLYGSRIFFISSSKAWSPI
jgi:hypothetical protein